MVGQWCWSRGQHFAFFSDDPSSNPAGYLNFLYKKTKINLKKAEVGPSLKKIMCECDEAKHFFARFFLTILVLRREFFWIELVLNPGPLAT